MIIKYIHIIWLYIRNFITLTLLEVGEVHISREIFVGKTRARIQFTTKGCHRISIDRHIILPGNVHGVFITEREQPQTLTFNFHGWISERTITINVQETDIQFFNQFKCHESTNSSHNIANIKLATLAVQSEVSVLKTRINVYPIIFNFKVKGLAPE